MTRVASTEDNTYQDCHTDYGRGREMGLSHGAQSCRIKAWEDTTMESIAVNAQIPSRALRIAVIAGLELKGKSIWTLHDSSRSRFIIRSTIHNVVFNAIEKF